MFVPPLDPYCTSVSMMICSVGGRSIYATYDVVRPMTLDL